MREAERYWGGDGKLRRRDTDGGFERGQGKEEAGMEGVRRERCGGREEGQEWSA